MKWIYVLKVQLIILYFDYYKFSPGLKTSDQSQSSRISLSEKIYLFGLFFLQIYNAFLHSIFNLSDKLPFLPLLLTSVYCSVGVLYAWLKFYVHSISLISDKQWRHWNSISHKCIPIVNKIKMCKSLIRYISDHTAY